MKVIYVVGKLTAPNNFELTRNVRAAEDVGMEVAKLGAMPLIPHSNTGLTFMGCLDPEFWYEGTLELMRRTDALMLVEGWADSKGSNREVDEATKMGLPIFDALWKLSDWLAAPPVLRSNTMRDFHYVVSGRPKSEKKFDIRLTLGDIADEILDDVPFIKDDVGPLSSWEIRDGSGILLGHDLHFGEVDLVGRVFFISPKAGVGG